MRWLLDDRHGGKVAWKPEEIGGRRGGSEVYRAEEIELRAGDRIRWTRNDAGLGLVNSRTAEVLKVANGRVTFRLEDGKTLELGKGRPAAAPSRPRLGVDRARLPGPHGGQRHRRDGGQAPASDHAEKLLRRDQPGRATAPRLVTDDAAELRAQLQAATGERIAALEGIGEMKREAPDKAGEAARDRSMQPGTWHWRRCRKGARGA